MTSKFFPRRNNVKCGYGSHCKECEKEKESKRIRIPSFCKAVVDYLSI